MQPTPPYEERTADGADGAAPRSRADAANALVELDAVIVEIEAAREGAAELDARIHFGFRVMGGHSPDIAALLIGEGVSWPTVKATLNEAVPPYTSSLDAAIGGEHIVFVLRSAKRARWGAMQRATSGAEVLGWAATEPLARRLACLKAWRGDIAAALEGADAEPTDKTGQASAIDRTETAGGAQAKGTVREAPTDHRTDSNGAGENKDWEVLF